MQWFVKCSKSARFDIPKIAYTFAPSFEQTHVLGFQNFKFIYWLW